MVMFEKKIAYKTFLALKDRLSIIGRLLCLDVTELNILFGYSLGSMDQ